jgi:hypothetical protein
MRNYELVILEYFPTWENLRAEPLPLHVEAALLQVEPLPLHVEPLLLHVEAALLHIEAMQ